MRFLIAKTSPLSAAVSQLLARAVPAATVTEDGESFGVVIDEAAAPLPGLQTLFEAARRNASGVSAELLGVGARDQARINQWLGVAADLTANTMHVADAELLIPAHSSFVAGTAHVTAADLLMYVAVGQAVLRDPKSYPKLAKWAQHVAADPLVAPFAAATADDISAESASSPEADKKRSKFAKPNEEQIAARRAAKEKEKAEKEKNKETTVSASSSVEGSATKLNPLDLDIRVGIIRAVEKHPKADRLFVETIDLGETSGPRQIVSGLVEYYTADQLLGQAVPVVANMKPKPLVGINSCGMVLCASVQFTQDDGTQATRLELVPIPPAAAVPGARVSIGGQLAPTPPGPSKKISELLAPLRTDSDGAVLWGVLPLAVGDHRLVARVCSASVK